MMNLFWAIIDFGCIILNVITGNTWIIPINLIALALVGFNIYKEDK